MLTHNGDASELVLLRQTHVALLLATGVVVAMVESGIVKETDRIIFTGAFAQMGVVNIKAALDAADHALGLCNSVLNGAEA